MAISFLPSFRKKKKKKHQLFLHPERNWWFYFTTSKTKEIKKQPPDEAFHVSCFYFGRSPPGQFSHILLVFQGCEWSSINGNQQAIRIGVRERTPFILTQFKQHARPQTIRPILRLITMKHHILSLAVLCCITMHIIAVLFNFIHLDSDGVLGCSGILCVIILKWTRTSSIASIIIYKYIIKNTRDLHGHQIFHGHWIF